MTLTSSRVKRAVTTSGKGEPGEIADAPFKSVSRNEKAENIILAIEVLPCCDFLI